MGKAKWEISHTKTRLPVNVRDMANISNFKGKI
jgi:hypothetical protein